VPINFSFPTGDYLFRAESVNFNPSRLATKIYLQIKNLNPDGAEKYNSQY
jgi:hypothetical protein